MSSPSGDGDDPSGDDVVTIHIVREIYPYSDLTQVPVGLYIYSSDNAYIDSMSAEGGVIRDPMYMKIANVSWTEHTIYLDTETYPWGQPAYVLEMDVYLQKDFNEVKSYRIDITTEYTTDTVATVNTAGGSTPENDDGQFENDTPPSLVTTNFAIYGYAGATGSDSITIKINGATITPTALSINNSNTTEYSWGDFYFEAKTVNTGYYSEWDGESHYEWYIVGVVNDVPEGTEYTIEVVGQYGGSTTIPVIAGNHYSTDEPPYVGDYSNVGVNSTGRLSYDKTHGYEYDGYSTYDVYLSAYDTNLAVWLESDGSPISGDSYTFSLNGDRVLRLTNFSTTYEGKIIDDSYISYLHCSMSCDYERYNITDTIIVYASFVLDSATGHSYDFELGRC